MGQVVTAHGIWGVQHIRVLEFGRCIQEHVARCKKSHCRRHLSPTKSSVLPWLRRGIRSWRSRAETVKCGRLVVTVQYTPCHPSPYSTNHSPATEKRILINLRHYSLYCSHFSSRRIITPSPISTNPLSPLSPPPHHPPPGLQFPALLFRCLPIADITSPPPSTIPPVAWPPVEMHGCRWTTLHASF